jgi:hypothetical protein
MSARRQTVTLTEGEIIEDAEYLAKSGSGFRETASRMGMTCDALEQRLRRADRADLYNRLRSQDPDLPESWGTNRTRYEAWAASPTGRAVLHRAALHLERARGLYPDTERDQAARRLAALGRDCPGRSVAA